MKKKKTPSNLKFIYFPFSGRSTAISIINVINILIIFPSATAAAAAAAIRVYGVREQCDQLVGSAVGTSPSRATHDIIERWREGGGCLIGRPTARCAARGIFSAAARWPHCDGQ